jgi:methionyl-tRNA synthetase
MRSGTGNSEILAHAGGISSPENGNLGALCAGPANLDSSHYLPGERRARYNGPLPKPKQWKSAFVNQRRILVTSALPYANGPIHIGHLVEYIQTDIWVRFQKLAGNRCVYVCADDTHGTAIMISARKAGISEETFIAKVNEEHQRDFAGFQIEFDNYGSTNCPENRELCGIFWQKLRSAGLIKEKSVDQLYDTTAGTFLADRFVKGTCPKCKSPNQYGDNCDKCSSTYSPADLIDPVSTLSGTKPEVRSASHQFVELEKLHSFLNEWTQSGEHLQQEVANY